MKKIRVLVVDDSALMRRLLTELINSDPAVRVIGAATDPYDAREQIKTLNPDVITLDIEMPKMDGLQFLTNLMRLHPLPVVMVSTQTQVGADMTFRALDLGAVDFVGKPRLDEPGAMQRYAEEVIAKIKAAAQVDVSELGPARRAAASAVCEPAVTRTLPASDSCRLVAIGASTGGTEAIRRLLQHARADGPGVVIVQHIPAEFSAAFAARLDRYSRLSVCEAEDGQEVLAGHAYVAPGNRHLTVCADGGRLICRLDDDRRISGHRPSVDRLFASVAEQAVSPALGILLTGMGRDGADGLLAMRRAGARTIAQDRDSSQIWGMPRVAVELDAACEVLPLAAIAARLAETAAAKETALAADIC